MAMPGMKSRAWKNIVIFGSLVLVIVGFGGLFVLQGSSDGLVQVFVIGFGLLTFALFAGPGIVYVARKRIAFVKKKIPGGTLAWIRAHLYLPVLALVATWVHATIVPFRVALTSGKVLAMLGIVVSIGGWARHKMIGVDKVAINADVKISRIAATHGRSFRQLVTDFKQLRRPTADIEADVGRLPADQQASWAEIVEIQQSVDDQFPRGGGQTGRVRALKAFRSLHAPLTIVLFVVLAFHMWDVLGAEQAVFGDEKTEVANAETCAECHSGIYDEWARSAMAHAQTSTIMEAQLPITLTKNIALAEDPNVPLEPEFAEATLQACINCHAPTGGQFTQDPLAFLPLDENGSGGEPAVSGGDKAVNSDGVSCVTCHTFDRALGELEGLGPIGVGNTGSLGGYGDFFGPVFDDPSPLPVRIHGIEDNGLFNDPIAASESCGACHNVKVDLDADGLSPDENDFAEGDDDDGDFQLDANELDNADGTLDDLVLQTTFDEWQDYVQFFDERFVDEDLAVDNALGCVECHMPSIPGETEPLVDYAPGFLPLPERETRDHSFIGVDYDPDPEEYVKKGLSIDAVNEVIVERQALLETAVTLEVVDGGVVEGDEFLSTMIVKNNLLGHSFPTGFAFARQFFFEVSAETADGEQVCLSDVPVGDAVIEAPCVSGDVPERTGRIPQCDPVSVAELQGVDRTEVANGTVDFADAAPVGECDPWLANYQKILTDGDPDGDGIFAEVPFQTLLPDIVKTRVRVFDGQSMDALQPTRVAIDPDTGEQIDLSFDTFVYGFDTTGIAPGTPITVTAKLRFRHLPPEFVRGLETELEQIDDVPESAKIDAEELVGNIVISDIVEASSNEGEILACEGPQNDPDGSLLKCLDEETPAEQLVEVALPIDGLHDGDLDSSGASSSAGLLPWVVSGLFAAAGWSLAGLRRRSR